MKIGFDHEKYLEEQSKYILERVNNYDKLTYYFDFDSVNGILTIKMSDGSKYHLDLNTYLIAK